MCLSISLCLRKTCLLYFYFTFYFAYKSPYQQNSSEYVRWLFLFPMKIENSNAFQWKKIVLCQQQTSSLHTFPISSFFIYLSIKHHVKHQRQSFLQQQKATNQVLFYPLTIPISNNALFEKRNVLFSTEILKKTHAIQGEYRVLSAVNWEK